MCTQNDDGSKRWAYCTLFQCSSVWLYLSSPIRWRRRGQRRPARRPNTKQIAHSPVRTVILFHSSSLGRCPHGAHIGEHWLLLKLFLKESGLYKHFNGKASSSSSSSLSKCWMMFVCSLGRKRTMQLFVSVCAEWHPITMKQWANGSHCCIIRCMSVYYYSSWTSITIFLRSSNASLAPKPTKKREKEKEKCRVHRRPATERVVRHWIDESNYHYLSHYYDCY